MSKLCLMYKQRMRVCYLEYVIHCPTWIGMNMMDIPKYIPLVYNYIQRLILIIHLNNAIAGKGKKKGKRNKLQCYYLELNFDAYFVGSGYLKFYTIYY